MSQELRILMLEDTPTDAELEQRELRKAGIAFTAQRVQTRDGFIQAIEEFNPDLILSDYNLPDFNGMAALDYMSRNRLEIPVIMVTGALTDVEAVGLIQAGAKDYVLKDRLARLGAAVLRVLSMEQGIRARKQAEESLRQSEAKFRALVESSSDWIWEIDEHGVYTYSSPQVFDLLGYTAEEVMGKTLFALTAPGAADLVRERFITDVAARKTMRLVENVNLHKDGRIVYLETSGVPILDAQGVFRGYRGVDRDITARKVADDALRRSEEKYRTLIQKIQAAVVVHGADTRILTSNSTAQEILGLTEDQLHGKTAIDPEWHFFREDGSPATIEDYPVNKVLASRRALKNYVLGVHRLGHENDVWALINADPVFGNEGDITQIIVTFIDITERKRVEEALAVSELEFRTLAENIPDSIIRYDTQARKIYINSAVSRQMGVEPGVLLGKTREEKPPAARAITVIDDFSKKIRLVLETGVSQELDVTVQHAVEGRQFQNVRFVAERDEQGKIIGALAIGRNLTAQKIAEKALKESEQRYREIFDNVSDSLYLIEVTLDGHFLNLAINPAFEKSSGMTRDELIGKYTDEMVSAETGRIVNEKYRRCIEVGTVYEEEVTLDMPSGRRTYYSTLIPVRDESGRFHRIVGISRDITDLKKSEHLLEASYAQLQRMITRREKDLEQERKHIARELHDELGQLLGLLRMNISLLPDRIESAGQELRKQSRDMLGVVDRCIKVMREVVTSLRPVALDAGIAAALEWLTKEFTARTGIECKLSVDENENPDETLSITIFRIVQESLTNVTRHAQNATQVKVELKKTADRYLVRIADNGKGFDTRIPRNKESFGLSGMEERCRILGGSINVTSAIGNGTTLDINLPLQGTEVVE